MEGLAVDIIKRIRIAKPEEMQDILMAVLERYRELYPDWDINVLSLEKNVDKNEQIDATIALLQSMKE